MDSREIVRRSLTFAGAPRIAMALPDPHPNDLVIAGVFAPARWQPSPDAEGDATAPAGALYHRDEWGNLWQRVDNASHGQVLRGALEDWADLASYVMPRLDEPARYVEAGARFAELPLRYHLGMLPGFPFAIMRNLRRIEIFLADVLLYPREVRQLADRVVELLIACMDSWARAGADGVMFCEDWGTQERLLVSPALWREMFKPDYARLCAAARRRDLTVWMHSCGYIWDIIPDLVECGVDVLQLDQPALFGVERLAAAFGGRANFWCPVDIQKVLPTGDLELIDAFARELVNRLGGYGRRPGRAGFIAGYYPGDEAVGFAPEWQAAASRAFVRYGGG